MAVCSTSLTLCACEHDLEGPNIMNKKFNEQDAMGMNVCMMLLQLLIFKVAYYRFS